MSEGISPELQVKPALAANIPQPRNLACEQAIAAPIEMSKLFAVTMDGIQGRFIQRHDFSGDGGQTGRRLRNLDLR
jgi:hypothetical protein